jgi:hypothetical protein
VLAISGLSRGFNTCCLRFKSGVAITHAKLASGWLARLYREGVEPSGCGFRGKAATDSDGKRPPNPIESGHLIRTKAATLLMG